MQRLAQAIGNSDGDRAAAMDNKPTEDPAPARVIGIGAISKATGVPVPTLRTWERRYGFPVPIRLPSGHRRYDPAIIEHIEAINHALNAGYRASEVVGLSLPDVRGLLTTAGVDDQPGEASEPAPVDPDDVDALFDALSRGDDVPLDRAVHTAYARLGALDFTQQWAGPFLTALGQAWETGKITVSQEHLASERIRSFLTQLWRPLANRNTGPMMVLTTLPGEQHDLGLHLAACAIALGGARVRFLGTATPLMDICSLAKQADATAVAVSVSRAAPPGGTADAIAALRTLLPDSIGLLVGGTGWLADTVDGVDAPGSLAALRQWVEARLPDAA